MDFSKQLFRCSQLGGLMTEAKDKDVKDKGDLGATVKNYLRTLYREMRYNRRKEFSNKYIEKGLQVEEDSITLYSRLKKRYFKKNTIRLYNDYITGEPDLYVGLEVSNAEEIIDTKSSWDLFTLPFPDDKLNKDYYWQAQGYMALSGAKRATIAYCLIDTPEALIEREQRMVMSDEAVCDEIRKRLTFDDIPIEERVIEFKVQRCDEDIERLYGRIEKCREHLQELDSRYRKPILITPTEFAGVLMAE